MLRVVFYTLTVAIGRDGTNDTTSTAEKPALSDKERAQRLALLAKRLRDPDGLDHDTLAQIEQLTGDEQ